ncbi:peptidoglycan-binding protein [Desulforhopalus vacuolatus]|uniref:peptidoglycan-binding protein n=1 Tax=Desulforhopalus vacuolatus TaxID=40414 RepID=UPI001962F2FE|nr:peptidoglycan-binding protein [Desulforhopalus vacuolatus]MBM9519891.1 peptidoglycan-binding protein [Desulforhopalus vacuolatus]
MKQRHISYRKNKSLHTLLIAGIASCMLFGCSTITPGAGGTAISGGTGGSTSVGANASLEHCSQSLGTIAIDDGRDKSWYAGFYRATNVTTIEPLIRLAVQQSNCFVITSAGNIRTDDRLSRITSKQRNSGEYRAGSKQQKGQRVAADYYLEPSIVINNSSIGGVSGTVGGVLDGVLGTHGVFGSVGGGLDVKSSVVTLSLMDIRSAVQIAAAEGSATSNNYGAALGIFGRKGGGALSGYQSTPAGKATVAAFLDAYNTMVRSLRNYKAQSVKGGLGTGGLLNVN